jgi:signal transduction histidine kinase
MRHAAAQKDRRDVFQDFLVDEIMLVGLLGAALALFLSNTTLRTSYALPQLRLVLTTVFVLAGGLVALLTATRFSVEGRRFDLLLCGGFITISVASLAFTIGPAVTKVASHRVETWAEVATELLGWSMLAAAPFAHGRHGRLALWNMLIALAVVIPGIWVVSHTFGIGLTSHDPSANVGFPVLLTSSMGLHALLNLIALVGFANRFRVRGEDLDRWLALAATLTLFSSLDYIFTPLVGTSYVSQGDFLQLLTYGLLLVGVWRAIQASEFGRAVAEERARVAREIHDGLAQYLFAVSTHTSLLEAGADLAETLPRLKEAALAAQSEARFAILALSSAAGNAPFDAALRRYVDFLTADGALEVELEIDSGIRLAPDEQIEIFRIVQESLGNARKHAHARTARVTIGQRGGERLVTVRDDGSGFEVGDENGAGQGLKNIRQRAATIGGAFSLASAPGRGTALEVVLRS